MSLETKIMTAMKDAMKAKNQPALEALRAIKSEILLFKTSGGGEITENDEIALLQKLVKQRRDAAEQFSASGRKELEEKELSQIQVIQEFLPAQLSDEELKNSLQAIIDEVGAESPKDMGKVMGKANAALAGKAEGKRIADMVKNMLNS